ncbi:hypothetical protein ACFQ48_20750 [Hymenobacter caeli]|uniref:Cysteine synthase n=1 Tax=Hymenobacter caeli TaxID=2735894 RepID=A0ABX2FW19_9BACT|nr:hypothetical protein [Hymenobacter caeli]NRT21415.1 cysteine synthase [Hymenobacter caeli]
MKKTLLTFALAVACLGASAQSQPAPVAPAKAPAAAAGYAEMLGATVADLMKTGDPAALKAVADRLERAAAVAPADWLPRYYQAYALTINAFQSQEDADAKDKTLDRAEAALAQARQLKGDASEMLVLQAYLYQARLRVAPMARGQQYSELVDEAVAQAQALNPNNPRAYLILANNLYYTPAEYGGGPATAKPLYEKALALFAAEKPATPLSPAWGQARAASALATINGATASK